MKWWFCNISVSNWWRYFFHMFRCYIAPIQLSVNLRYRWLGLDFSQFIIKNIFISKFSTFLNIKYNIFEWNNIHLKRDNYMIDTFVSTSSSDQENSSFRKYLFLNSSPQECKDTKATKPLKFSRTIIRLRKQYSLKIYLP